MVNKPFISILIPVKNFERTIEKTFEYLLGVDYPRDSWEWIIADGGSTDKTLDIIKQWQQKYPFIKLVSVPNSPTPGYARNKALEHVRGDYIFFTDADCAPCSDWINQMLKIFDKDEKIAAVGGEVYTLRVDPNNLVELWCQHFRFNMVSPRYAFIKEGYFPTLPEDPLPTQVAGHRAYFFGTCNVAYKVAAMKKIGARFWDNPTGEDMDLSFQHQTKGWKYYFLPTAKVDHMHRADIKALRKVWVAYGAAHMPLLKKYLKKKRMEIIFQFLKGNPAIHFPFPLAGFIYVGNFHLLHIFGLAMIIGLILSLLGKAAVLFTVIAGLLTLYFAYQYIKWNLSMEPKSKLLMWCKMKYLTNLSFFIGGLKDFKKYKVLCIEPSF
ncbi:MAG: glycosyltransferase [Candidatus Omnitrophica bacterium]|nr:glycosyltransferase [Candidatus Omnitrophota bacterium]